jgi:hypothetical protein
MFIDHGARHRADAQATRRSTIAFAGAFKELLEASLSLGTRRQPPTQVGIVLRAQLSVAALVELGELHQLGEPSLSREFLGFVIGDPTGKPATEVTRDLIRQLFDYTLHVGDFDSVLAALGAPHGEVF